jgi:hypothetical protein
MKHQGACHGRQPFLTLNNRSLTKAWCDSNVKHSAIPIGSMFSLKFYPLEPQRLSTSSCDDVPPRVTSVFVWIVSYMRSALKNRFWMWLHVQFPWLGLLAWLVHRLGMAEWRQHCNWYSLRSTAALELQICHHTATSRRKLISLQQGPSMTLFKTVRSRRSQFGSSTVEL